MMKLMFRIMAFRFENVLVWPDAKQPYFELVYGFQIFLK